MNQFKIYRKSKYSVIPDEKVIEAKSIAEAESMAKDWAFELVTSGAIKFTPESESKRKELIASQITLQQIRELMGTETMAIIRKSEGDRND